MATAQTGTVQAELDYLTERIVRAVWGVLPGYGPEHMARNDLERFVRPHVKLLLRVRDERRRPTPAERRGAQELGASRALQGVPVDSIVRSFRVAERAVVESLLEDEGPSRETVRDQVRAVGQAIDDLCEASLAAYRKTQSEVTVHYDRLEADLVARLSATDRVPPEVAEQARTVGADPDRPHLALAAALRADPDPASLVRVRRSLLGHVGHLVQGRILAGTRSSQVLLVVPVARDTGPVRTAIDAGLADDPILREVVVGSGRRSPDLATVGRSTRQALLAAEAGQALGRWGRIVPYRQVIPEALFLTHPEAGDDLVRYALGPILDDGRLLETLGTYLDADLSQRRTAERLGVHPNTVAYRLRRIAEETRRDLGSAADLCELSLALRAMRLRHGAA